MGFPLLLIKPTFYCYDDDNKTASHVCLEKEFCDSDPADRFVLNTQSTITSYFELYCDRNYINGVLGSVLFLGNFSLLNSLGHYIRIFLSFLFLPLLRELERKEVWDPCR